MLGRKLFRVPKHNRFNYNPQYWNPEKEELEERLESIRKQKEGGDDSETRKSRMLRGMRAGVGAGGADVRGFRSKQVQKSNNTLLLTLGILVAIAFFAYKFILAS